MYSKELIYSIYKEQLQLIQGKYPRNKIGKGDGHFPNEDIKVYTHVKTLNLLSTKGI